MPPKDRSSSPRTARQTRSDFDLEPNPFEESFRAPQSASSNVRNSSPTQESVAPSSDDSRKLSKDSDKPLSRSHSRSSHHRSQSPSRPVLPPLSSISSPADPSYSWNYSNNSINSLRAGPLSPAMLAGPQASDQHPIPYDPASFRTGLTPRSGLTPASGLTPLVGGPTAFNPNSPSNVFMALMNNANSAAPSGATITPNTLNALSGLSGVLNNSNNSNTSYASALQHQAHHSSGQENNNQYISSANDATNNAANGLFLLSQAHQELTKREEAQARAGAAANGTNGTAPHTNGKRGTKRKSYDTASPPPTALSRGGKRSTRANSAINGRRKVSIPSDDGMDDDDDGAEEEEEGDDDTINSVTGRKANKKPETEEEKRKNFLERNRQAALKCRQRKKAWLAQLQAKVEYLSNENERLTSALVSSREEISRLSALVGGAGVVGGVQLGVNGVSVAGPGVQPVSMNVSLPSKNGAAPVSITAGGNNRPGYGY